MSDFKKLKQWLQQVSFLTEEDCKTFEPYLTIRKVKAKENILVQGQVCKEIGFINSGAFRIYYLSEGNEINTHFGFENDFIVDYDSFLQEKASRHYIQALEDSELTTFNLSVLQEAYNSSHNWERFGRIMAESSYKIINERVESFLFMDGEQRYLQLLKKNPQLLERVPLYHVASYLGIQRESLSRLRKKITSKERL